MKITAIFKMGQFRLKKTIPAAVELHQMYLIEKYEPTDFSIAPAVMEHNKKILEFRLGKRLKKDVYEYNFERIIV